MRSPLVECPAFSLSSLHPRQENLAHPRVLRFDLDGSRVLASRLVTLPTAFIHLTEPEVRLGLAPCGTRRLGTIAREQIERPFQAALCAIEAATELGRHED